MGESIVFLKQFFLKDPGEGHKSVSLIKSNNEKRATFFLQKNFVICQQYTKVWNIIEMSKSNNL